MQFKALSALALLAAVARSNAQSGTSSGAAVPTSTAGLTPCIITCITQASAANGCSGL